MRLQQCHEIVQTAARESDVAAQLPDCVVLQKKAFELLEVNLRL